MIVEGDQRKLGFSLLETIISFIVLSIIVGALYKNLIISFTNTTTSVEIFESTEFGSSFLEEISFNCRPTDAPVSGEYGEEWYWEVMWNENEPSSALAYDKETVLHFVTIIIKNQQGRILTNLSVHCLGRESA